MNARRASATTAGLLLGMTIATAALPQKQGGILRVPHRDSPASMSILEEETISAIMPMMGGFTNLVLFDQHVPQNRAESIVPDLASVVEAEDGTELTFKLRNGVKWPDGKPFSAADVNCTYDLLMGKTREKLRLNFREAWFFNLAEVTTNGDAARDAHASGPHRPVQICRIQAESVDQSDAKPELLEAGPAVSRRHRIFDGRQPLDGDPRLRRLEVRHDLPHNVTVPLLKDVKSQAPQAICELKPMNGRANLLVTGALLFGGPDHLLHAPGDLLAARGQGLDLDRQ